MKFIKQELSELEREDLIKKIDSLSKFLKDNRARIYKQLKWLSDLSPDELKEIEDYFIVVDVLKTHRQTLKIGYTYLAKFK